MAEKAAPRRPAYHGAALLIALLLAIGASAASGCLLTNINADACDDVSCVEVFGLGSSCKDGFCSAATECATAHDCRRNHDGGACVEGICVNSFPPSPLDENGAPLCALFEPEDLSGKPLTGADSAVIVGGMFRLADSTDPARANGAMLAIREINSVSRLNNGRQIAMVVCNNGGAEESTLPDEPRRQRQLAVIDYLGGTLGVPYVVGPVTSTDSLTTIGRIVSKGYPTVLISPSATSPQLTSEPDRLSSDDAFGLFWRTAPSDELQGAVLANSVVGQLPIADPMLNDVAVVFLSDAYGQGLANVFQVAWGDMRTQLFPFDETSDFMAIAADVAAAAPDAILMIAIEAANTVDFIRGMVAQGMENKFLYLTDGSKDGTQLLEQDFSSEPVVQDIILGNCPSMPMLPLTCSPGLVGTAPAGPRGADFNLFAASLQQEFQVDPTGFSFVANAYDAGYLGAYGVVFASQDSPNWDGRTVAAGLARLVSGAALATGKDDWAAVKNGLTSGSKEVDITGISGPLDFDVNIGEAPAPTEVWDPTPASGCPGSSSCFAELALIQP